MSGVRVSTVRATSAVSEQVPEHFATNFERSILKLSQDQTEEFAGLLTAGMFAQHEFGLVNFTHIQHRIVTGTARPITQK